jgi:hypothetical protein
VTRARDQLKAQGLEVTEAAVLDLGQDMTASGLLRRYGRNEQKGGDAHG